MKIENLKKGMVLKNYKELCEVLEEKTKTGKSKQLQMIDFERHCKYHKEGFKFVIDEIYQTIKAKTVNKNNKYAQEIGDILVEYLYKNCKETSYRKLLSLNQVIEILGVANENYAIGNRHKRALSDVLNVDLLGVHCFYNNTRNEFKQIIERSLNNLKSRRVLNWNKTVVIAKSVYIDDDENNIHKDSIRYIEATKEEEREIINIEKRALKSLGLSDARDLFLKNKTKDFQKLVKKEIRKDWKYYFYAYDLNIGDEAIEIEHESIQEKRISMNKKMKERAKKRLKASEEEQEGKRLIDELIDISQYDFRLGKKIEKKKDEMIKEQFQKIDDKYLELTRIENKKERLLEEIEELEEFADKEFNMDDYKNYINSKNVIEENDVCDFI